jgi:lysophospholipase L1-like esterase
MAYLIAALGDSLTSAPGYLGTLAWPEKLDASLADSTVTNYGVAGKTTADQLPTFESSIRYGVYNTFCLLLGTNDIRLGTVTKEQCLANLEQMWNEAAAEGMVVVAVTILPHKNETYGYWDLDKQSQLEWVNTGIRSYCGIHGIRLIDAYALYGSGGDPAVLNPAYTYDGLHFNEAGATYMATLMEAAITGPAPTTTTTTTTTPAPTTTAPPTTTTPAPTTTTTTPAPTTTTPSPLVSPVRITGAPPVVPVQFRISAPGRLRFYPPSTYGRGVVLSTVDPTVKVRVMTSLGKKGLVK